MNERLCVEQVGVDLEPCVHAHGHDVYLIMEASLKIIIPLLQDHLVSLDVVSTKISSFDPFLGQVKVLVFCSSLYLSNPYSDLPSSITLWCLENNTELHNFL